MGDSMNVILSLIPKDSNGSSGLKYQVLRSGSVNFSQSRSMIWNLKCLKIIMIGSTLLVVPGSRDTRDTLKPWKMWRASWNYFQRSNNDIFCVHNTNAMKLFCFLDITKANECGSELLLKTHPYFIRISRRYRT